jgi:hypothetical protein
MKDGFRPMTGNVWWDGAILALVLFGAFAIFAYYLSRV